MVVRKRPGKKPATSLATCIDGDNLSDDEVGMGSSGALYDALELHEKREDDDLLEKTRVLQKPRKLRQQNTINIFPVVDANSCSSDEDGIAEDVENDDNYGGWGSRKQSFYGGNPNDKRAAAAFSDESELDENELEAKETRFMQTKMAQQLTEDDFFEAFQLDQLKEEQQPKVATLETRQNLSKLSSKQRRHIFHRESPEFAGIAGDFVKQMEKVKSKLKPIVDLIASGTLSRDSDLTKYIELKYHIILNYCLNIMSYIMLKVRGSSLKLHPVTSRLVQYKQLLTKMEEQKDDLDGSSLDATFMRQGLELMKTVRRNRRKGHEDMDGVNLVVKADRSISGPRKRLRILDTHQTTSKCVTFNDVKEDQPGDVSDENEALDKIDTEVDSMDLDGDGRRLISYQIAKNKGLKPTRSKLQRNPRVKYRAKYRDALIRRKGQVRSMRKETHRYVGEMSGINARVKKGIKLM